MKTCLSFLVAALLFQTSWSQKSYIEVYESRSFICDDKSTTIEINICSGEKTEFADSLLNRLFKQIIQSIDKDIKHFSRESKAKGTDSTARETSRHLATYYAKIKTRLIEAQLQWKKSRDADSNYEAAKCERGTGCVAIVNELYLKLTLDRIRLLEQFRDDH